MAPPPGLSSASDQRVHAAQVRLKRFPASATTLTPAVLKPRSASGNSFAEKMVTVAYNVSCRFSHPDHGDLLTCHQIGLS